MCPSASSRTDAADEEGTHPATATAATSLATSMYDENTDADEGAGHVQTLSSASARAISRAFFALMSVGSASTEASKHSKAP
eukprot:CAMPEP_0206283934 /NCGR_PEP_ID=MMETSP0047_2-20121206/40497_1 /ASSEMBLY_ACC=CAM_ASM_000192 /TAXON_ID=195065 /ORGANISM="Chroomonas mesostigmatica_cf, Strain CCMP1168" /LENGTH=81 /DNA_ID=CAMNT_0053714337 /DNA_START=254 /DNA_END=500 /DNA_ORIENTATION=+